MYIRNVSFIIGLTLIVCQQLFAQCTKDTDCKGERVCINGECVDPDEKDSPRKTEISGEKSSMGKFMFYIDPVGGLFFGTQVGFEIGVGPNTFIDLHYRHSAFGIVYDAIATERFQWYMKMGSGATGAGFKHYLAFSNLPHRLYLGAFLDYGWSGVKNIDEEYPAEEWETSSNLLFLAGDAGWFWRFGGPFNLGLGLIFGVAIELRNEKVYNPDYLGTKTQPDERVYPGGGLQLLLNFEFGKN